ncbi:10953_t:CDS:10 [Acaulospora colombiana]|uniref:10953_t:CDS:1 n=1 Tax=Acaulospora colombiana TaxID=27376 RepID=A0ACA9JXA0_9GLOM|nr:10953_t:CDS:10 [Acaulospora colombiana]
MSTSNARASDATPDGMTANRRIINVTHMIPYDPHMKVSETEGLQWSLTTRRGHSALYSGIRSLDSEWNNYHVGFIGPVFEGDKQLEPCQLTSEIKESLEEHLAKAKIAPVWLEDSEHHGHYEGFCKTVLWPLFHYILWENATDGREEKINWEQYLKVNSRFTDKICKIYQPGDLVWIHDYHLLMVPQMLRERIPNAAIGLFIHAPFPSSEIFRCLPRRKEVLNGMLGANQIGFQVQFNSGVFQQFAHSATTTLSDRHDIALKRSNCTRILGYESTPGGVDCKGSIVSVGPFPIGIDTERIERQRKQPEVLQRVAAIKEMFPGKRIIIGRDKLDLVKGVIQKLRAFDKFLSLYPEWQNKVVLIQVTSPALTESPKLERKVAELIAHINATYGSLEYIPVHHYHNNTGEADYFALLSMADIGLITSVRDGMNTTSLEYIMCQQENYGPLILSEFTGMAGSLSASIMVNPWDYTGVARAIDDALRLPTEEKRLKHKQLLKHVTSHTAQFWARSFIKELLTSISNRDQSNVTPYLDMPTLLKKYNTPSQAIPSPQMLELLQKLTNDPKNTVWVVSGRDQESLDSWLGQVKKLGFSAEHGSFLKNPDSDKWINLTEDIDMSWKNDVDEIFTYYTERTQGSSIEYKRSSITWHYRKADPEYGAFQAKECQNHLESAILTKLPVEILAGKKNLEVRPTLVNKVSSIRSKLRM